MAFVSIAGTVGLLAATLGGTAVEIPAGKFMFGPRPDDFAAAHLFPKKQQEREVTTFTVAVNLVTVGEFSEFVNHTGARLSDVVNAPSALKEKFTFNGSRIVPLNGKEDWPMLDVTWQGANDYCDYLSTGSLKYRLPTETEWEYLATNGGKTRFPWGDDFERVRTKNAESVKCDQLKKGEIAPLIYCPVGSHKLNANAWGVYDLICSATQWCSDEDKYPGSSSTRKTHNRFRVTRGGMTAPNNPLDFGGNIIPRGYTRKSYSETANPRGGQTTLGIRWVVETRLSR